MPSLTEPSFALPSDVPSLKSMWHRCFGDEMSAIDLFFDTAFSPEQSLVIRHMGEPVSMLFLLDAKIASAGVMHRAYYVYAVATSPDFRHKGLMACLLNFASFVAEKRKIEYLFLVPETDELYAMYEKFGYTGGIAAEKRVFMRPSVLSSPIETIASPPNEAEYRTLRLNEAQKGNIVLWGEKEYAYIRASKERDGLFIHLPGSYCFYEKEGAVLTVKELIGDKAALLSALFQKEPDAEKAICFLPCRKKKSTVRCGSLLCIENSPRLSGVTFGYPYG